jgi:basic membrane lipoprotein Med (substrate-binding protein (PBP1-ABC) superfamily)
VFDVGGRGDKSFNDGAYLGATRAAERLGARVRFIEPGEGSTARRAPPARPPRGWTSSSASASSSPTT